MASVGQQRQAQGLSLLNMENKLRQQPKIAHEHGAGSQCSRCGPKCSGFDLHYWRKICKNCRCVKEAHLVPEDDAASRVVDQLLFDDSSRRRPEKPARLDLVRASPALCAPGEPASPLDWVPPAAEPHLALKYMEQLPPDEQPIAGSRAAVERKRALERQLPSHDLDPERCVSLSVNEKRKMEDYVKQMKQNVVGQGLIQECPPRGRLPPAPPLLDRIIEQKVSQITLQPAQSKSPSVSPKPSRSPAQLVTPRPFVRFEDAPSADLIRKMSSKPHAGSDSLGLPPPPPPEVLQQAPPPLPAVPAPQIPSVEPPTPPLPPPPAPQSEVVLGERPKFDPVREFFDFLDEQDGKKLPGKLRSPFLHQEAAAGNFNAAPRPYHEQRRDPGASTQRWSPVNSPLSSKKIPQRPSGAAGGGRGGSSQPIHQSTPPQTRLNQSGTRQLLTTDFDYVPVDDNRINNNPPAAPLNNNPPSKQASSPLQKVKETPQGPVRYEQEIFELPEQQWHCHKCRLPVQPGTVAVFAERAGSDTCWHPQCFCCSICNERLADLIYFFVEGDLFCGRHYSEKMNIPRCKACDELIFAAEYTQAEGANWHMNHFCCWLCDTPLAGKQYTPVDEQPHCLDCYQKKYGKNCHECKRPILATERLVSHADWAWHDSPACFKCRQCDTCMIDRQFVWKNEQVFCSRDCFVQHNQDGAQQRQARAILIP